MNPRLKILLLGVTIGAIGMFSPPASAKPAGFCVECHSAAFLRNPVTPSDRSVFLAKLDPCPGLKGLAEEMYFNESRILKVHEILRTLAREGWSTELLEKKAGRAADSLSRLTKDGPISVREFARESSAIRSALQKVYDAAIRMREESDRRWLVGIGILCFIVLLILIGVGFHRLARMGKAVVFLLFFGTSLSLGACSSETPPPVKKSPAQESLEQSLLVGGRAAAKIEEGLDRSILLARLAREWSRIEPGAGEKVFHLAWRMALAQRGEGERLRPFWGMVERFPDRTAALQQKVSYDTVLDLRDDLRNADSRVWAMRAVAEEWVRMDGKAGRQALEFASQKAGEIRDLEIRDRELKSLAEAWAPNDPNRAWDLSKSIADPFLRSLALARLALSAGNPDIAGNLLLEAWKTASAVSSPYARTQALIRVSACAAKIFPKDRKYWADQALTHLEKMKNPIQRRAALQEMVLQWASADGDMAEQWAEKIPPQESEARAYAFLQLSRQPGISREKARANLLKSIAEAKQIPDSFESQKILSRAGEEFIQIDPESAMSIAREMTNPYFLSELLGRMAQSLALKEPQKAMDLAGKIPLEEMRAGAMAEIIARTGAEAREKVVSLYRETFQAAQAIADPYTRGLTLIELGKEWGGMEKGKEIGPLENALKTTEAIPNLSARAEVLATLAAAWKGFHPDTEPVILGRIDPSVAGAQKTLGEVRLWGKIDPTLARRWAESIPDSFPYEKALALKEVALNWKKSQPESALGLLEKALRLASHIPEGGKKNKLLGDLAVEAASLNPDWTLRWIRQIPDDSLKDLLFRGAGNFLAGEDPAQALKAAGEISESSLRLPLYHRAAEGAARKTLPSFLSSWGAGREKAKRDEREAVPFFEKALQGIEKVSDPKEKAYLLCGLAADWAPIDEKKALQIVEKIPANDFPEPHSYALLQVAGHYGKWSRKEAESLFPKTLTAAEKIGDPSIRARRFLQIARLWKPINPGKGMEVLGKALAEARKGGSAARETIILTILQTQASWEPEKSAIIAKRSGAAATEARILLEGSKVLRTRLIDEKNKVMEQALLLARKEKNERLMGDVATAWFALVPRKGMEVLGQMESRDLRVQTLRRMAQGNGSLPKEEKMRLLDQASDEAARIEGIKEKIQLLKKVASDMAPIDKERARATYLKAYQIAEREFLTTPRL